MTSFRSLPAPSLPALLVTPNQSEPFIISTREIFALVLKPYRGKLARDKTRGEYMEKELRGEICTTEDLGGNQWRDMSGKP